MTNKDLNKILKQLEDFNPQAKPNWEAFLAENETRLDFTDKTIDQSDAGKTGKFAGLKIAAVIFTLITGIFFLWYFSDSDQAEPVNIIETIQSIDKPVTLDNDTGFPDENTLIAAPDQKVQEEEKANGPLINKEDPTMQTLIDQADGEAMPNTDGAGEIIPALQPANPVVIKITDTVRVRKTIYISDTVKIKNH